MLSVLNNCTLTGNSAGTYGGGFFGESSAAMPLRNCIIYYNSAPQGSNYVGGPLVNCCAMPAPLPVGTSVGNITNAPLFVDPANGNFRLQSNSPCINSGNNAYATNSADLDGNPRIQGGTVDIGAYEYQTPASIISYAWLQQYGLPTDGSADFIDTDQDGMNNWQEWIAGTDPTSALSELRLSSVTLDASGAHVTWQSVGGRTYVIEASANLGAHPAFLTLATNIAGQAGTTTFTDTNALGNTRLFYRVGILTSWYRVQTSRSAIPFGWLQQYGLPTDGSADFIRHRPGWYEQLAGMARRNGSDGSAVRA